MQRITHNAVCSEYRINNADIRLLNKVRVPKPKAKAAGKPKKVGKPKVVKPPKAVKKAKEPEAKKEGELVTTLAETGFVAYRLLTRSPKKGIEEASGQSLALQFIIR